MTEKYSSLLSYHMLQSIYVKKLKRCIFNLNRHYIKEDILYSYQMISRQEEELWAEVLDVYNVNYLGRGTIDTIALEHNFNELILNSRRLESNQGSVKQAALDRMCEELRAEVMVIGIVDNNRRIHEDTPS